jgi:hypothetical protein
MAAHTFSVCISMMIKDHAVAQDAWCMVELLYLDYKPHIQEHA